MTNGTIYEIIYVDMVSDHWPVITKSPLVPSVGDLVNLPYSVTGRVSLVEHVYKLNIDEFMVLDYIKVYLDWKTK